MPTQNDLFRRFSPQMLQEDLDFGSQHRKPLSAPKVKSLNSVVQGRLNFGQPEAGPQPKPAAQAGSFRAVAQSPEGIQARKNATARMAAAKSATPAAPATQIVDRSAKGSTLGKLGTAGAFLSALPAAANAPDALSMRGAEKKARDTAQQRGLSNEPNLFTKIPKLPGEDAVKGFLNKLVGRDAQAAEPAQGRVNVVDIGGQKRYFADDESALAAAIELDQQQQAPAAPQAPPAPGAQPQRAAPQRAAAPAPQPQSGSVNVIRGSQQFVRGADGTERIAGVSDPRLAELLAARDSAIRNRPRNIYDPSSVPSPEASVQSADKAFGDSLAFIADGDRNATELAKARIAASSWAGSGANNGLTAKDLLQDAQKGADRRLKILEAMNIDPAQFAGFLRSAAGAEQDPAIRARIAEGNLTDQELMNIGAAFNQMKKRNDWFLFSPSSWFDSMTPQQAYGMIQNGGADY